MTDQDWKRKKERERLRRLKGIQPFVDNKLKAHTLRLAEFRAKSRVSNLQKHANSWKQRHENARLVRLDSIQGTVNQRLHPSSKHFMERHRQKSALNPMGSHSALQARKNEKVRLKRLARVKSTFKTSTLNRLHKSTKEYLKWKSESRKRAGEHANKWETKHERERLRRLQNTKHSVNTILPKHITRKRAWDLEQLRRKGYDIRPHTKSAQPCEALKVSGGDYLRLDFPPLDQFGRVSSRWGGGEEELNSEDLNDDKQMSSFSPGPLDRVGVHVPKMESMTYSKMMQNVKDAKSQQNQDKKRKIFAKILAKALHRESQRTRRLQQCRTDAERKKLNRRYRKERLKCENELKELMRKTEVISTTTTSLSSTSGGNNATTSTKSNEKELSEKEEEEEKTTLIEGEKVRVEASQKESDG